MKLLVLDFEFCGVTEPQLNLVSCATTKYSDSGDEEVDWWLHDDPMEQVALADYLTAAHAEGYFFVAFGAEAEARSCIALGLDPVKFNWICEHLEYRCLQNHSYELLHGEQLIDGKVKRTYPFGEKGKQNLGAVTFKLLGKIIDTKEKDEVRQLIISSPATFTEEEKQRILSYGRSDVRYLDKILKEIVKIHVKRMPSNRKNLVKQMLMRGNYAARTAKMVALGYPVNVEWLKNFAANAPMVLQDCARDINRQFPDNPPFRWHKKEQRFALTQKVVRDWIHAHHPEGWELTETGQYSLSADAFSKKYSYRHTYPEGHLGAQIMRFKKLEQSLRGYNPHAEKSIFNDLGSDGRVRTYLNPYGAQSSRSQAGSTGFIFLKPAFQRTLVQPPKGKCIGDCDWSSEEFLLAALMSGDRKMIEAYKSGDVYLAFGKDIGFIPQHGTKKTHKRERDICKACLAEGTLVFVEGKGLVAIENVKSGMRVWNGIRWVKVLQSARKTKAVPAASLVEVDGVYCTPDHLILNNYGGWNEASSYSKEDGKWEVCKKDCGGLHRFSFSWTDVWRLACQIGNSYLVKVRAKVFSGA